MKAEELRIGNLVLEKGYEITIGVIDSHYHSIQIFNSPRPIPIEHLEPIPLTEEWLVKFGFTRELNQETWFGRACWNKGNFHIMHGYGTSTGSRTKYEIYEFDFVHQLQNLYFALTGKELELK